MDMWCVADAIHQNAVAHGWWDEPRTAEEIAVLINAEWSEALEAFQAHEPMEHDEDGKPEGIAVELVDGCIRILDYLATTVPQEDAVRWQVKPYIDREVSHLPLPRLVYYLTEMVVDARRLGEGKGVLESGLLRGCITTVMGWCKTNGADFCDILKRKHEYNRTRPYRHGGKRI